MNSDEQVVQETPEPGQIHIPGGGEAESQDVLDWGHGKAIEAFRSIGYSFEQAVADIVDNSIDAGATAVRIRFLVDAMGELRLAIADNGAGMDDATLKEAVRIGAQTEPSLGHLGKYGLGLKLATFSHAKSLTVLTRKNDFVGGRRITIDSIKNGNKCDVLSATDVDRDLKGPWGELYLDVSGTVVIWSQIDRIPASREKMSQTIKKLQDRLQNHLGIVFHRFIEDQRIRIIHDRQDEGESEHKIEIEVSPLNPFGYPASGHRAYPKQMRVEPKPGRHFIAVAHVWPENSPAPGYKLGGGANRRQGFYFYRNDRLIQAGGWNGLREPDPHLSLARVEINLPATLDNDFSLDLKKSGVEVPQVVLNALFQEVFEDGTGLKTYIADAQDVYRKNEDANRPLVAIPRDGIPDAVTDVFRDPDSDGQERFREIRFEWARLFPDRVFELDLDNDCIKLNKVYRSSLIYSTHGSKNDAPALKALLFLLIKPFLQTKKWSKAKKDQIELINSSLLAAAKVMGGKG